MKYVLMELFGIGNKTVNQNIESTPIIKNKLDTNDTKFIDEIVGKVPSAKYDISKTINTNFERSMDKLYGYTIKEAGEAPEQKILPGVGRTKGMNRIFVGIGISGRKLMFIIGISGLAEDALKDIGFPISEEIKKDPRIFINKHEDFIKPLSIDNIIMKSVPENSTEFDLFTIEYENSEQAK